MVSSIIYIHCYVACINDISDKCKLTCKETLSFSRSLVLVIQLRMIKLYLNLIWGDFVLLIDTVSLHTDLLAFHASQTPNVMK